MQIGYLDVDFAFALLIGPRVELREEFIKIVETDFWMYTVDLFIEEAARVRNKSVKDTVLEEIKTVREEVQAEKSSDEQVNRYAVFEIISREEILRRIRQGVEWARGAEGFLGLQMFVKNYLGRAGFDYSASYDAIHELQEEGLVEIYQHQGPGHTRPVTALRLARGPDHGNRPFEELRGLLDTGEERAASRRES
jgi:hypothetical protein